MCKILENIEKITRDSGLTASDTIPLTGLMDFSVNIEDEKNYGKIVNVSLGLPIVRTSVDHGTALELSGTGNIKLDSLKEAFTVASKMI